MVEFLSPPVGFIYSNILFFTSFFPPPLSLSCSRYQQYKTHLDAAALHEHAGELLASRDRYGYRCTVPRRRSAEIDGREVVAHGSRVIPAVQIISLAKLAPVVAACEDETKREALV